MGKTDKIVLLLSKKTARKVMMDKETTNLIRATTSFLTSNISAPQNTANTATEYIMMTRIHLKTFGPRPAAALGDTSWWVNNTLKALVIIVAKNHSRSKRPIY